MRRLLIIVLSSIFLLQHFSAASQGFFPSPVKKSQDVVRIEDKLYYIHVVTEKQTMYSICKAYGVGIEDVYESNKALNLRSEGIKTGQIIYIPVRKAKDIVSAETALRKVEESAVAEPAERKAGDVAETEPASEKTAEKKDLLPQFRSFLFKEKADSTFTLDIPDIIHVAIILPFHASDSIPDSRSLDFYSGALMAARDLGGTKKVPVSIRAVDCAAEGFSLDVPLLTGSDLIIGPIESDEIRAASLLCPPGKAVVSPLEPRAAALADSLNVIQAPTPVSEQIKDMVRWAVEDMVPGDTLVVISEKDVVLSANSLLLLSTLEALRPDYVKISYALTEGLDIQDTFTEKATATGTNRYLIASDDESFINDAVRNVNLVAYKKNKVVLYCPSRVKSLNGTEIENLHNANAHMVTTYFVDYFNDPAVRKFLLSYRALFGAEPNSFAFQGYDTLHYFVTMCSTYGRMWSMKLPEYSEHGLQTDFRFDYAPSTGNVNRAVRRVVYSPDFQVRVIR